MRLFRRAGFVQSFSLVEMTLGMAILVLVFGGIFNVVQGTLISADVAERYALRMREDEGLFSLMREIFLGMPPQSQVLVEKNLQELVLFDAPVVILSSGYEGQRIIRFSLEKDRVDASKKNLFLEETILGTNSFGQLSTNATNRFLLMNNLFELRWTPGPAFPEQRAPTEWRETNKPPYVQLEIVRRKSRDYVTNRAWFWIPTGY